MAGIVDGGDAACGRVSVSLPSLRVDAFTVGLASEIQRVKRTGLTFAPEGGTWRMRQVINKLIREEDLYAAVDAAFSQGWRRVKLYFLIGLPTETDEDVLGIVKMAGTCVEIGRRYQKSVTVTASVGGFVPKAHTPFQWFGQDSRGRAAPQGEPLEGRLAQDSRADAPLARPCGDHSRRDREPWRSEDRCGHRARLAIRRHLPGVVGALRSRALARRPRAGGTHRRRRGPSPPRASRDAPGGTTSRRASTGTSCGRTTSTRSGSRGSRTAAGPLATTAGHAPTTGSSTSWHPTSRPPEGAREPGRTCPRGVWCRSG